MSLIDYVNPFMGTDSVFNFSNGNTLPLITRPFGMNAWTIQSKREESSWFFNPNDPYFYGLRLTHQPSPWIGDYGQLLLMPQAGKELIKRWEWGSSFKKRELSLSPDYLNVFLNKDRIGVELTPTERGAYIRLKFSEDLDPRLLLSSFEGETHLEIIKEDREVIGYTRANSGGVADNFAMYFVLSLDCDFDENRTYIFNNKSEKLPDYKVEGEALGSSLGLKLKDNGEVNIRIATSFISIEQARHNMERELGNKDFEHIREEGKETWEDHLGRIHIKTEDEAKKRIFYSSLYRNLLFPRIFYEWNEDGKKHHYSPFDGKVYEGSMYTDNGFWDTYRTTYPLFSLLYPSRLEDILEGWVNAYKENRWMPRWLSPGERDAMPGTLIDGVFADAVAKNITNFDLETAYEGLIKHASIESDKYGRGREGLSDYLKLGYLPEEDYGESVNNSLDYAYGDFCIAQIAKKLGKEEDYEKLMKRAENYKKLFDREVSFMRGKNREGNFKKDFDPIEWGGPFCEGSAWQCSWAVQHDLLGLAHLMGGKDKLKKKIEALMVEDPLFRIGSYGYEIHEMSEMAEADFGQCAISNQPSFHIPYIFAAIGYPHLTQYWVREAMERLFSDDAKGFPGDEDNGSLGAWYIFSSLGFYPLCPGTDEYVFGSPVFDRVEINYESGKKLVIKAKDQKEDRPYVNKLFIDGEEYEYLYITQETLTKDTSILFEMGKSPKDLDEVEDKYLPYSMSKIIG